MQLANEKGRPESRSLRAPRGRDACACRARREAGSQAMDAIVFVEPCGGHPLADDQAPTSADRRSAETRPWRLVTATVAASPSRNIPKGGTLQRHGLNLRLQQPRRPLDGLVDPSGDRIDFGLKAGQRLAIQEVGERIVRRDVRSCRRRETHSRFDAALIGRRQLGPDPVCGQRRIRRRKRGLVRRLALLTASRKKPARACRTVLAESADSSRRRCDRIASIWSRCGLASGISAVCFARRPTMFHAGRRFSMRARVALQALILSSHSPALSRKPPWRQYRSIGRYPCLKAGSRRLNALAAADTCSRNASSAIFAFSPAPIFRLVRHAPLRSMPFGADFLQPSQWFQNPGPLQTARRMTQQMGFVLSARRTSPHRPHP